jgi:hypothetical protein
LGGVERQGLSGHFADPGRVVDESRAQPSPLGKDGGLVERALPVVLVQLSIVRPVEGGDQTDPPLTP